MLRFWSVLVVGALLLALCGCPGGSPEKDGGNKPTPSEENGKPKPAEDEPGGEAVAANTGKPVAVAVGFATNRDPAVAARRATTDALEKLGIPAKGIVFCEFFPQTVTVTTEDEHGIETEVEQERPDPDKERMVPPAIREAAGAVPAIGCRARALVRDGIQPGDTVAVLAIGGDDVSCRAVKAELVDDRKAAGAAIAKGLAKVKALKLAVVFADRELAYNEKPGVSADDFVRGLLEAAGKNTILFGGIAMPGGDADAGQGGVFLGDKPLEGHAVALGIGGPIAVHAATAHEFVPAEATCTVTKSDGKWVEQLDDRPAAEVYREIRGMEPDDEFTRDWQHPIGVVAGPEDMVLRMVLDEDKPRGALRLIAPIAEGTEVKVLYGGGNAQAILDSAGRAIGQSLEKAGDEKPLALLVADADARGRRLREIRGPDAGAIEDAIAGVMKQHRAAPIFGLSTFGELGPGAAFRQQAVVSVVITEQK